MHTFATWSDLQIGHASLRSRKLITCMPRAQLGAATSCMLLCPRSSTYWLHGRHHLGWFPDIFRKHRQCGRFEGLGVQFGVPPKPVTLNLGVLEGQRVRRVLGLWLGVLADRVPRNSIFVRNSVPAGRTQPGLPLCWTREVAVPWPLQQNVQRFCFVQRMLPHCGHNGFPWRMSAIHFRAHGWTELGGAGLSASLFEHQQVRSKSNM